MWTHKASSLLPKLLPMTTSTRVSTRYLSAFISRRTTTTVIPSSSLSSSSSSSSSSPLLSSTSATTASSFQQHQHQGQSPYLCRYYVSRAHPRPIPEYSVPTGLQMVLDGVEERKTRRATRWEQNKVKRQLKGIEVSLCISERIEKKEKKNHHKLHNIARTHAFSFNLMNGMDG
ncbi:MAG: hypothetical protein ACI90V_009736 [Bacillariaceae sp.]|jgi:hypothetical protein